MLSGNRRSEPVLLGDLQTGLMRCSSLACLEHRESSVPGKDLGRLSRIPATGGADGLTYVNAVGADRPSMIKSRGDAGFSKIRDDALQWRYRAA